MDGYDEGLDDEPPHTNPIGCQPVVTGRQKFVEGSLKLGTCSGKGLAADTVAPRLLVACPSGHELSSLDSDGGWTCDACGSDIGRRNTVLTCSHCDVALCIPCRNAVRDKAWADRNQ